MSHRKGFRADGCLSGQARWQSFLPHFFFFFACHPGITQLLRGGQLTAIHPLISADTMLELVLSVGGSRLEPDCDAGFEDGKCWTLPDAV